MESIGIHLKDEGDRSAATNKVDGPGPARLKSVKMHLVPGQLLVAELFLEVPLDYTKPSGDTLVLFGRAAIKYEKSPFSPGARYDGAIPREDFFPVFREHWMLYLEGGPGFGNKEPQDHELTKSVVTRGYQILYLDYRGTGLSTPVDAQTLGRIGSPQEQADYLKLFRADNIVRDCEAVRQCLTADAPPGKKLWSLVGQSFGGFVSLTYLSFYPAGLREVFITGGLAPTSRSAQEVYEATYRKLAQRNRAYFKKFPEDVWNLQRIASYLKGQEGQGVALPGGGQLTTQRVFALGQAFGFHGGLDMVHGLLLRMGADLDQFPCFTRATLKEFENFLGFDSNPLYAVLHEPLYCHGPGRACAWAAEKVGRRLDHFGWLADPASAADQDAYPMFFAGEMVYRFMFDTFPGLRPFKEAAEILANFDGWPALYDEAQLARNKVPVFAAAFIDDLYVDYDLALERAAMVGNTKVFATNTMYHTALRTRTEEVLRELLRLRDDTID